MVDSARLEVVERDRLHDREEGDGERERLTGLVREALSDRELAVGKRRQGREDRV
jgi:hypothetical protein